MIVQEIYEASSFQDIGGRAEQQDRVEVLWSNAACLAVLADGMGATYAARSPRSRSLM